MSEVDIWKDAPEGSEFIVEFTDGELYYYKTEFDTLFVCTPYINGSIWRESMFGSLDGLLEDSEEAKDRKQIHHKQN